MEWMGKIGLRVFAKKLVGLLVRHFDLREYRSHWILDVEFEDLLEKDALMVYQHCGLYTLLSLWENLPSLHLYLAETCYFDIKKRYIRTHFKKGPEGDNAKELAVKLGVSHQFVHEALATIDEKNDARQQVLL